MQSHSLFATLQVEPCEQLFSPHLHSAYIKVEAASHGTTVPSVLEQGVSLFSVLSSVLPPCAGSAGATPHADFLAGPQQPIAAK